ncbi:hypothetical protein RUND412_004898 [Rhizina undulata]
MPTIDVDIDTISHALCRCRRICSYVAKTHDASVFACKLPQPRPPSSSLLRPFTSLLSDVFYTLVKFVLELSLGITFFVLLLLWIHRNQKLWTSCASNPNPAESKYDVIQPNLDGAGESKGSMPSFPSPSYYYTPNDEADDNPLEIEVDIEFEGSASTQLPVADDAYVGISESSNRVGGARWLDNLFWENGELEPPFESPAPLSQYEQWLLRGLYRRRDRERAVEGRSNLRMNLDSRRASFDNRTGLSSPRGSYNTYGGQPRSRSRTEFQQTVRSLLDQQESSYIETMRSRSGTSNISVTDLLGLDTGLEPRTQARRSSRDTSGHNPHTSITLCPTKTVTEIDGSRDLQSGTSEQIRKGIRYHGSAPALTPHKPRLKPKPPLIIPPRTSSLNSPSAANSTPERREYFRISIASPVVDEGITFNSPRGRTRNGRPIPRSQSHDITPLNSPRGNRRAETFSPGQGRSPFSLQSFGRSFASTFGFGGQNIEVPSSPVPRSFTWGKKRT